MPRAPNKSRMNRFVFLVTWRRQEQKAEFGDSLWRGFVCLVRPDGSYQPRQWFQSLEELGGIVKRSLPDYALQQNQRPDQHPNIED
jgi:hypothetical protein